MPIHGYWDATPPRPLFYKTLQEFDHWAPGGHYDGVIKYKPRKLLGKSTQTNRGKLLVCHDYKGGYTESSFTRSYTFNFWSSIDIFVYFSHHRITIPPPGWISAAHRQGVKILGTLIFESGGEEDSLRLIIGKFPSSRTGQVDQALSTFTIPMSPHYAKLLAALAHEGGFDGYLLNFECPLGGSFEQTRALAAWITVLQSELRDKVGSHAETIWYDSVIVTGDLAWQDRLNSYNLPFFLASTGFFTNYTWRNHYPALSAQYLLSLSPDLIGSENIPHLCSKTAQHIYVGIDIWGRGSHGGGGFGAYRALDHISPDSLGLSVAVFGQAWTWESREDKEDWSWNAWWDYDRSLWTGPASDMSGISLPEMKWKQGETICEHHQFKPIGSFFTRHSPPDPADIRFHTSFCPGTGLNWFVEGRKVFQSEKGWTDVDKQTSFGNILWPCPTLYWEDEREDETPTASVNFYMDDAWNGGNSLCITISCPGSDQELAAYRPLWLPIQSLDITPLKTYRASAVYKLHSLADGVETEFALALRPSPDAEGEGPTCTIIPSSEQELSNGWMRSIIEISVDAPHTYGSGEQATLCIGLVLAVLTSSPSEPIELSILLGELNVSPLLPLSFTEEEPLISWADFTQHEIQPSKEMPSSSGTLSWEVASTFPSGSRYKLFSPDDPNTVWNSQPTVHWFPSFLYFNIYAQPFRDQYTVGKVDEAIWIGTSGAGWSGSHRRFVVYRENLPFEVPPVAKIRFYVQGVSDRGEVMKWHRCAFVDVSF